MENENMRSIFSFRIKLKSSWNLFIFYSFIALLLTIKFSSNIYPIKFRWAVEKGAKYKVVSYVYEKKFRNSVYAGTVELRNKAVLTTTGVKKNSGFYEGDFYYYERDLDRKIPFHLKQIYPTKFWRDSLGRFTIDRKFYMPVVRDVPVFPKKDIKPGYMWHAKGMEVHDLKQYGLKEAYSIPIDARYIYVGNEKINGRDIAKFSINYIISHKGKANIKSYLAKFNKFLMKYRRNPGLFKYYKRMLGNRLRRLKMAPKRILGACNQLYYWDIKARLPLKMTEDFHFIFHLYNGDVHEYKGISKAVFKKVNPMKKHVTDKIVKKLRKKKFKGIGIKKDKRGIVLVFKDILFGFDKHNLSKKAVKNMKGILKILKKYSGYDIRVEGHTDSIGTEKYNMLLSNKRANSVSALIAKLLGISPKKVSWIGFGQHKPIDTNKTKKGRQKNRRVEVIILTNE